eukprot:990115_1
MAMETLDDEDNTALARYKEMKQKQQYIPLKFQTTDEETEWKVNKLFEILIDAYALEDKVLAKWAALESTKQTNTIQDYLLQFEKRVLAFTTEIKFRNRHVKTYNSDLLQDNIKAKWLINGLKQEPKMWLLKKCFEDHGHCVVSYRIIRGYVESYIRYEAYAKANGIKVRTVRSINETQMHQNHEQIHAIDQNRSKRQCFNGTIAICGNKDCPFEHVKQITDEWLRYKFRSKIGKKQCKKDMRCRNHANGICWFLHEDERNGKRCIYGEFCTITNCQKTHVKRRRRQRKNDGTLSSALNNKRMVQAGTHASVRGRSFNWCNHVVVFMIFLNFYLNSD